VLYGRRSWSHQSSTALSYGVEFLGQRIGPMPVVFTLKPFA
jgi:hypothetical protein